MVCFGCDGWASDGLCGGCRRRLRPAGPRTVGGLRVSPALVHDEVTRRLVHALKYRGALAAADLLAEPMRSVTVSPTLLVPIPRRWGRRIRYGVDPGWELAVRLGRATGNPIARLLIPRPGGPAHAGRRGDARPVPRFARRGEPPNLPVTLVDDVLTTGSTLMGARLALGSVVTGAVTATVSGG